MTHAVHLCTENLNHNYSTALYLQHSPYCASCFSGVCLALALSSSVWYKVEVEQGTSQQVNMGGQWLTVSSIAERDSKKLRWDRAKGRAKEAASCTVQADREKMR